MNYSPIADHSWGGVKYNDILWIILFVCTYLYVIKKHKIVNPLSKRPYVLFVFVFILELSIEAVWPYDTEGFNIRSVFVLFKYLFSVYVYLVLIRTLADEDYRRFLKSLFKFQYVLYAVAAFEFVYENILGFGNYGEILVNLFGPSEHVVAWDEVRFGLSSIQGLCKEPSHFAILLFFLNLIYLLIYRIFPLAIKLFIVNCFLMLISGSLSSVLYIAALVLFWISYIPMKHKAAYLSFAALVCVGVLYYNADIITYYSSRLSNIASFTDYGIDEYTSEGVRLGSAVDSWRKFLDRPLLGVGLGNNVNSCGFFTMLSTIGVVGLFVYLRVIMRIKYQWVPFSVIIFVALFAMDGGLFYSSHLYFVLLIGFYSKNYSNQLLKKASINR